MNAWQEVWDFEFPITANQPVWFMASTGEGGPSSNSINGFGDNQTGELKCFAIAFPATEGAAETQVSWNHLYGSAIVFNGSTGVAFEYPAWAFTARGNVKTGDPVGDPGTMLLTGGGSGTYDACPAYLIYNFFAARGGEPESLTQYVDDSYIALSPCYQDLRQDRLPTCTKAKFDIWNENERKLTGTYHCVKCWFEGDLDDFGKIWDLGKAHAWGDFGYPFAHSPTKVSDPLKWTATDHPKLAGANGENFEYLGSLHTAMGRFRVTGINGADVCRGVYTTIDPITGSLVDLCKNQVAVPFIGLKTTLITSSSTSDELVAVLANTGSTAGAWVPLPLANPLLPTILWDAAPGSQQAQGR